MTIESTLLWSLIVIFGIVAGTYVVYGGWRAMSAWRLRRAGPRRVRARRHVLWRDPGEVAALDLAAGPGGRDGVPVPPFTFIEEQQGGTHPSLSVHDARGRRWRVKWGEEVNSETFAVRIAWACGYIAEVTYYVPEGGIEGVRDLQRASACLDETGRFTAARFELDDPAVRKLFDEHSWAWNDNPFLGSHELQGLKILTMLLSNWDTKDCRDVARGSNTAIFEHDTPRGREAHYLISDWGGSMGSWGSIMTRARWDAAAYEAQTPQFISAVHDGIVKFVYSGQRTEDIATGITVEDARWLSDRLSRLTDAQVLAALDASGASADERERFSRALRARIDQLSRACAPAPRS
jgi:hypothetical protein